MSPAMWLEREKKRNREIWMDRIACFALALVLTGAAFLFIVALFQINEAVMRFPK